MRSLLLLLALSLAVGCRGHTRYDKVHALSPAARDQYATYRQFMTEGQQEAYLDLKTDEARSDFIAKLHVEERLARFPEHIREAIWAGDVIPGMDKEAVLLSWGVPSSRDIDERGAQLSLDLERWTYHQSGKIVQVVFAQGLVTSVEGGAATP